MRKTFREWLIVLASLADDAAVTLVVFLTLWLLKVPLSLPLIFFLAGFFVAFSLVVHKLVLPALRRRKTTGAEGMVGLEGDVVEPLAPDGLIKVKGEYWKARSVNGKIPAGESVEVLKIERLSLEVKRKSRPVLSLGDPSTGSGCAEADR